MSGCQDWLSLAESADADELREHILTGFKDGKPFTPYTPTLALPSPIEDVLDFGCGLGRNFPYLKTVATRVGGFDLPPMIARCRTLASEKADWLDSDWARVKTQRFDLIFAALVLQHVETVSGRSYLSDFARMAPAVYLLTRADSDFGANVLDLVAESGVFDPGPTVEVDHDAETHQLRIVGRTTFAQARASGPARHFEILLRSRLC